MCGHEASVVDVLCLAFCRDFVPGAFLLHDTGPSATPAGDNQNPDPDRPRLLPHLLQWIAP